MIYIVTINTPRPSCNLLSFVFFVPGVGEYGAMKGAKNSREEQAHLAGTNEKKM